MVTIQKQKVKYKKFGRENPIVELDLTSNYPLFILDNGDFGGVVHVGIYCYYELIHPNGKKREDFYYKTSSMFPNEKPDLQMRIVKYHIEEFEQKIEQNILGLKKQFPKSIIRFLEKKECAESQEKGKE